METGLGEKWGGGLMWLLLIRSNHFGQGVQWGGAGREMGRGAYVVAFNSKESLGQGVQWGLGAVKFPMISQGFHRNMQDVNAHCLFTLL